MMRTVHGFLFLAVLSQAPRVFADDWPQFLGPQRNGICNEKNLIDTFPEDGPKILWRTELGVGMSGVAISNGSIYTLYQDDKQQYVVSLKEKTGKERWKTPVAPAYENAMGNGPRATPTVVDDVVYAFTGDGMLAAVATKNGKVKWKIDAPKSLTGKPADYGMSSSPLVVNDTVIVQVGSTNGNVVGFDIENGERKWIADYGLSGYSSPVVMTLGGAKQIVAFSGEAVIGASPDDGSRLWKYAFETDYACNTATPVQLDDSSLLISAGENHGSAVLTPVKSDGSWTVEEAWTSFGKDSVLRAEWQTPVLIDEHLFGLDNIGSAGPITNLVCISMKDKKQVWMQPRFGKSNLIYADGKLFISTMRGELVIVMATPEEFKETAREVVLGMTRQAPVIANGKLYLRDDKEVVCIDVQKSE